MRQIWQISRAVTVTTRFLGAITRTTDVGGYNWSQGEPVKSRETTGVKGNQCSEGKQLESRETTEVKGNNCCHEKWALSRGTRTLTGNNVGNLVSAYFQLLVVDHANKTVRYDIDQDIRRIAICVKLWCHLPITEISLNDVSCSSSFISKSAWLLDFELWFQVLW